MTPDAGARIRKRRQELRLTQEELARRVGVHASTVGNWEKGKHFPRRYQGAVEAELGISLSGEKVPRIVSPRTRRVLSEELPPEDYRRVIGLLEGTLTWPGEQPEQDEGPAEGERSG